MEDKTLNFSIDIEAYIEWKKKNQSNDVNLETGSTSIIKLFKDDK